MKEQYSQPQMVVPLYSKHLGNHFKPWIGLCTKLTALNADVADLDVTEGTDICGHFFIIAGIILPEWTVSHSDEMHIE